MKAMARKFQSEREEFFVMGYSSRPTLHVKPKERERRTMWLSFSDALVRYGAGLRESDLGDAYRKAGVAFRGQLEQNFVVLHENQEIPRNESNEIPKNSRLIQIPSETGTPRKRARGEVEHDQGAKNPKIS